MKYSKSDHTFVVCAFGKSIYLERCIKSLLKNTTADNIKIATSTPSEYIDSIGQKYHISVYNHEEESNIAKDWNCAYGIASTPLVTLAHQDDEYCDDYLKRILEEVNRASKPIIVFTNYGEIRGVNYVYKNKLLKIKRILLCLLKHRKFQGNIFIRRRILSLGNPICCPSVTYVRENITVPIFEEGFTSNIDWQAWEKISRNKGQYVYCTDILMFHRVHAQSTTTQIIASGERTKEDLEILELLWPKSIARIISKIYAKSQRSNGE